MYRILYIDEDDSDRREFKIYCKNVFEVITIHPPASLQQLFSVIDEIGPDAIVTDYHLTEHDASIEYNGDDVVSNYLQLRHQFPVFLLTSYEDTAINEDLDPSYIYTKDVMSEAEVDNVVKFRLRVSRKIEVYKSYLDDLETRILELKEKGNDRSDEDKALLIQLDSELERTLGSNYSLGDKVKEDPYLDSLKLMLDKADELLNALK